MTLLVLALALQAPPPAIEADGVPPVPAALRERLAQYLAARSASFEDWGPDGSMLIATRFGETAQLHLVPFPGGRREQLTFADEPVGGGLFLPGGDLLYAWARGGDENWQILRLDRRTGRSTMLTDGRSRNVMGPLSRKGDRLVYSSNRRNSRDMDLWLLDLGTGESALLMEAGGQFWSATDWSQDDARLALLRTVSVNESYVALFEVASRTRRDVPVPSGPGKAYGVPRFGPDGDLYVTTDATGEYRRLARHRAGAPLALVDADPWDVADVEIHGSTIASVTNEDGASCLRIDGRRVELPLGILSGLKFSRDGRHLGFTLSRPDAPSDAYSYCLESKRLVRWTHSEAGGLDPSAFVVPSRIAFKSFDGREIPAYVYRPRREGKSPVVVTIHGGPESQFRPFFNPLIQHWVNELGFAVIAPNVRGSTGYGKTYVALDNAEKREDAVKDIGALLDWIAAQPDLDAGRTAVHGGSYGGYMVLASLVHYGDRLKAGVDVVGIANFRTFLEKTSGYRVDLRRAEYGDERDPAMQAVFDRISPANHAGRIRSALLVAHGKNDPRVPFAEAVQIAGKVRANGRPVWTVYAANEGHGFGRKENRDYVAAVTALFLQTHLR